MAASRLDLGYPYKKPSSFLNSIFMSTVNVAANTLVSVASDSKNGSRWRPTDHLRFMFMLTTWFTVWILRVFMDWFPVTLNPSRLLGGGGSGGGGRGDGSSLDYSYPAPLLLSSSSSSPSPSSSAITSLSKLDIVPYEAVDGPSIRALGRSLSHIFAILNEMPATSRKYQFAMSMAEKIMAENARGSHYDLIEINRTALSSGFARTSSLLYDSLHQTLKLQQRINAGPWPSRIVAALPFGSYVLPYMKVVDIAVTTIIAIIPKSEPWNAEKERGEEYSGEIVAEKLCQELQWMTYKLREYGAVDEAMLQWSFLSGLASVSVGSNPRVQGFLVKISAMLFRELMREDMEEMVTTEVKFRMLCLWLPLLCHARNGLVSPALLGYEKAETERAVNQVIGSLPAIEQEVILTNWLQDYSVSVSDWPNLQVSYDRWCHFTRELVE